jgi:superfamily II DNA or RNA helicase
MTHSRQFGSSQRMAIFLRSEGQCQICAAPIGLGNFHADHIVPWSKGGPTTLRNAQALCRSCNLKKSSTMSVPYSNHLPPGRTLRDWQEDFVNRFYSSALQQIGKPPAEIQAFILHAFPGSGKSLAQTLVARTLLEQNVIDQVIICVPSKLLRNQMEDDARRVGLFLNRKRLEINPNEHGLVVTYAQIGYVEQESGLMVNAERLRKLCQERRTMVIADEMHHLGQGRNWGDAFELAFNQHSIVRLMTSGTPFRSDNQRLPWVRYRKRKIDLSQPHGYSYGYGYSDWNEKYCALKNHVVRDVVFHPWDGQVSFTVKRHENGVVVEERSFSHKLSDNIDELYPDVFDPDTGAKLVNNKALRAQIKSKRREACIECGTARHPHGTDYVRDQLIAANDQLAECRRAHPWAGGLIVCNTIIHADAIARALKHWTGEDAVVVHSESGNDARAIKDFRENRTSARARWIVSVGKISEGVDIKHLRVGVYFSVIQAPLRWTQILGRILRTEDDLEWDLQTAHFFQYEDGIEFVEGEDGEVVASSANIKLFAESLMEERWVTLESREPVPPDPGGGDGPGAARVSAYTTVETETATGINTEQIYEGVRHKNDDLKLYQILAARLQIPAVKVAALIEKGGEDEWRRALEAIE